MTERVLQETAALGMSLGSDAKKRLDVLEKKCDDFREEIRTGITKLLQIQQEHILQCQNPPASQSQQ
jgi:hypothetical protein